MIVFRDGKNGRPDRTEVLTEIEAFFVAVAHDDFVDHLERGE
ncbi:MAG: hypothetical protein ABIZ81_08155 [Opitutaceae bacterium]